MKFNLCLMATSVHTQCFLEVMDGISWALQKLGHEVKHEPFILRDRWNIVFGARPGDDFGLAENIIFYNGEQASLDSLWPSLVRVYRGHFVWDYSAENAARYETELGSIGLAAPFRLNAPSVVRPGYAPVLDRIPEVEKTHDVVFFGSKNERRQKILDDLVAAGVKVLEVPFGVYGRERDALLAKAKYCLNVHYYQDAIFESLRCSYCMQNGIPVISEECKSDDGWGAPMFYYDKIAGAVLHMLQLGDDGWSSQRDLQRASTQRISLLDDVQKAVAELPELVVEQEVKPLNKRHKITLSMIVKNEADVIARCLHSVASHLTGYCIVDTGSTDGTQDIIRKTMDELGVPGAVHDRPWKEFDGSRTEALDLAREQSGGEGWLMLIDADETLHVDGELEIDEALNGHYAWVTRCLVGCAQWTRPLIVRADRPWFYEMPRHEGLYCREFAPLSEKHLANVKVLSSHEGARAKESAAVRFERDARVLEKWLLEHPGHARATYYIAQSYKDAGGTGEQNRALLQKAIMWYQRRSQMQGFDQETFSALYQAGLWMSVCGYPWERVQHQLMMAYANRPSRAEPLYHLAFHYRTEGQYALGAIFARAASEIPMTQDAFYDVDRDVYTYKAKDEWSVCLTYLNGHAKALELSLGYIDFAPEWDRARIQANIDMCKRELGIP